jgi:hypothetical protein
MRSKILMFLEVLLLVAAMFGAQACFVPAPYGRGGPGYYSGWGYGGGYGHYWHHHDDDDDD